MNANAPSAETGATMCHCPTTALNIANWFKKPRKLSAILYCCALIVSVATLATPSTAMAQGVVNGTFTIPQRTIESPWIQYYPSGIEDSDVDPGIQMHDGRLYMLPRPWRMDRGPCPVAADIAIYQYQIVPLENSNCEFLELEFNMKINLEAPYSCEDIQFQAWASEDLYALKAKIFEGTIEDSPDQYMLLGTFEVSTELADAGWFHYKTTCERFQAMNEDARYLISFQLGDMGETLCYEISSKSECIFARPNQANLEIDNVQLTARNRNAPVCSPIIPPGHSTDVISWPDKPLARHVYGGSFSGGGPEAPCTEVTGIVCMPDLNNDFTVDGADLSYVLATWGENDCLADFDNSGVVDGADLSNILAGWGSCD